MLLELPEFDWISARTVEETCALLAEHGEGAFALAGGTDLFTKMKLRRLVPAYLIDIKSIPGLGDIRYDERQGLLIGALATANAIESSQEIPFRLRAIAQAAAALGTLQIRNTATIGGNLANASPSAEFAPPLLALGASLECASPSGARSLPMDRFFIGPGKTCLAAGEIITSIRVPAPAVGLRSIYLKHSLRRMDVAIASVAVSLTMEGEVCTEAKIALGAVGPVPSRATRAEAALAGRRLKGDPACEKDIDEAARLAAEDCAPIDDLRSEANYRRRLVAMLTGKALDRLLVRDRA